MVFPRTAVVIQHEGKQSFVAAPPLVNLYNAGQRYRRAVIAPEGDQCEWFALSPGLATQIMSALDPRHTGDPAHPFPRSHGPSNAAAYLAQRRFARQCVTGPVPDALHAEEFAVSLATSVLPCAIALPPPVPARRSGMRQRDLVEQAKMHLLDMQHDEGVSALARRLGCSPFHLCRIFRHQTGFGLHAFREQLRLRQALEALELGESDFTELALSLGYSSHSHFSYAFRSAFGCSPRDYRRLAPDLPFWMSREGRRSS